LGAFANLGAFMVMNLLGAFNIALVLNLRRGRRNLDCQCYGRRTARIGWGHVAQNTVLLGIALVTGYAPASGSPSGVDRSLMLLASAYTAALFLAAQEMAGVRASLVRMLSRIETE